MSDIDVDRLKWDADYWDECGAPEDAAHVGNRWDKQPERGFKPCWYRLGDGAYFYYPEYRQWEPCANGEPCHIPTIPRPTKQEWEGGLPPVGCECEAVHFNSWAHVEVVAHVRAIDGPKAVFQLVGFNEWNAYSDPSKFRPLKSKAERQREELAKVIFETEYVGEASKDIVADAILSSYTLEEK